MTNIEPTNSSDRIFEGKILSLRVDTVELPNGIHAKREIIEHGPAVAIVPVDEMDNVYMVRQYRKAIDDFLLEIPAGRMEAGENSEVAAHRELGEETGLEAQHLEFLGSYFTTPGFTDEEMHAYLAKDLVKGEPYPDEDENVEVVVLPLETVVGMIRGGEIRDGKSIAGLLMAWNRLNN